MKKIFENPFSIIGIFLATLFVIMLCSGNFVGKTGVDVVVHDGHEYLMFWNEGHFSAVHSASCKAKHDVHVDNRGFRCY